MELFKTKIQFLIFRIHNNNKIRLNQTIKIGSKIDYIVN